jgi:MATE family multidrug resistance protein
MEAATHTTTAAGDELRALVRLAGPVVAAELGWMAMWLVDTVLVGHVSAEAIGAVSVGGNVFFTVAIFGMGLLLGLDFTVAHAAGAGNRDAVNHALVDGLHLALLATVGLTVVALALRPFFAWAGVRPAVAAQALPFYVAMLWSICPLLVFSALRRYLQALGRVLPIMLAVLTANIVNLAAGWMFIFGHLGAPALGAIGAGWATTASRLYEALAIVAYIVVVERRRPTGLRHVSLRPRIRQLARLTRLGLPAATQLTLEVGVVATATTLAATLDTVSLAAHQVALGIVSVSFMVPLGVASAAAVRVGRALGERDVPAARRAGWTALGVATVVMLSSGLTFLLVPRPILRVFTDDPAVIETGVALLRVAAAFQLFDGIQVVATGVLRGTGDTRTPMLANLGGHWLLGLPVGALLCFRAQLGVIGLWIGLSVGLIVVAVTLLWAWSRRLAHGAAPVPAALPARA